MQHRSLHPSTAALHGCKTRHQNRAAYGKSHRRVPVRDVARLPCSAAGEAQPMAWSMAASNVLNVNGFANTSGSSALAASSL